jgi:hypothetical protein
MLPDCATGSPDARAKVRAFRSLGLLKEIRPVCDLRFERFALARNAIGFFRVWVRPQRRTSIRSVHRLRMSANAHFNPKHKASPRNVVRPPINALGNTVDVGLVTGDLNYGFTSLVTASKQELSSRDSAISLAPGSGGQSLRPEE